MPLLTFPLDVVGLKPIVRNTLSMAGIVLVHEPPEHLLKTYSWAFHIKIKQRLDMSLLKESDKTKTNVE